MTSENSERANPFGDLATDFAPAPQAKKPIQAAAIDSIAEANGFPSRQAPKPRASRQTTREGASKPAPPMPPASDQSVRPVRRYTTGRNQQLNLKASSETISTFYRLADELDVPLVEVLEQAVAALDAQVKARR